MKSKHILVAIGLAALLTVGVSIYQTAILKTEPQSAGAGPTPGAVRENPKDGLKYVWIPPGIFMMGCSTGDNECFDPEKPAHQVKIARGFWIGQTEVTVAAWKRFAAASGHGMPMYLEAHPDLAKDDMPMTEVNWHAAAAYCKWAGGRLPTEAEWEYAARGGSNEVRPLNEIAWYNDNSGGHAHAVALKRPNGYGLYDMLGNAFEWVNDGYDDHYYPHSPSVDPAGPWSSNMRGLRGGSYQWGAQFTRLSDRHAEYPEVGNPDFGLRCVWSAAGKP